MKCAPGPEQKAAASSQGDKDLYSHFEGKLALDENGKNYNSDDEAVDAAVAFVRNRPADQPVCLFLGLMFPPVPYPVEEPYYSAIDRTKLPARVKPEECTDKSKMLELLRKYQQLDQYTERDWDELRAVYLGMCAKVDEQFRRLCDGLKEAGIYDDCAIFFLSDHGDFDGDYGLTEKAQSSFEDCLARVPLLVKPPKRTQFGQSLRPVIADRSRKNRSYVYCEGGRLPGEEHCDEYHSAEPQGPNQNFVYWPKMMAQTDDAAHAKGTMIRNQEYKYVSRITGEDEFYDLKKDSQERKNCIHDSAYEREIARMQVEMMKWYQRTCDVVPHTYDRRFTDEMLWAKVKNICPPEHEDEVKEMIRGGMKQGLLMQYIKGLEQKA